MPYKDVKKWRQTTKQRIVESMGGECVICGYNEHFNVFDLHHIDPTQKEFTLGSIRAAAISWDRIVRELRKCVLLCANCHRLLHANIAVLPDKYNKFDESFVSYDKCFKKYEFDNCCVCGKSKSKHKKTCSPKCKGILHRKVSRPDLDVLMKEIEEMGFVAVGKKYGVSDNAIRKWVKL
jgi:hypothetical protein